MADAWYTAAFGPLYPALYGHRDLDEARRCVEQVARLMPLVGPVLDLGCGDGRHLAALGPELQTVGLDLSPALLKKARLDHGPGAPLVRGDMRLLPVAAGSMGTVLSLFTAFGYFETARENARPVAEVARALCSGGHWCLDLFDSDLLRAELGDGEVRVRRREAGPLSVTEERRFDPEESRVRKTVTVEPIPGREEAALAAACPRQGLSYTEDVAVFTLDELDAMAAAEDLQRVAAAGSYNGAELGRGDRWLLAYRRGGGA